MKVHANNETNLLQSTHFKSEYDLNEEFRVTAETTVKVFRKKEGKREEEKGAD